MTGSNSGPGGDGRGRRDPFLAVGFNRVHSSLTPILKEAVADAGGRVTFSALVREPAIPPTHYYYWPRMGTRIAGNSCHWIDYAYHLLLAREPSDIQVLAAAGDDAQDNNVIVMRYPDGSLVSLTFANRGEGLINGDELLELKVEGAAYKVHDFKRCIRYAEGRMREIWRSPADRGWERELAAVVDGMLSGRTPGRSGSVSGRPAWCWTPSKTSWRPHRPSRGEPLPDETHRRVVSC